MDEVIPWERAEVAELLSDGPELQGPLARRLTGFDAALAYTRSSSLVASLRRLLPLVIPWDPHPPSGPDHASRWFARAAAGVAGVAALVEEMPPVHTPSPEETHQAAPWLARLPTDFLALHPGSGSPQKNWAPKRFAEALEALAPPRPWLLVEGPADREAAGFLHSPNLVSACGLPPRVLGAILARAGLFLGNDSGVSHLAAAWGAPTLALFGPTDPERWGPLGPRVTTLRSADQSMEGLAVSAVIDAARRALDPP